MATNYEKYTTAKAKFDEHVGNTNPAPCEFCRKSITDLYAPACPIAQELYKAARKAANRVGIN